MGGGDYPEASKFLETLAASPYKTTWDTAFYHYYNAMAGEKENLKIVERNNNELCNLQKYEIVDELVAENYVRHDLSAGQDIRGREAYVEKIKQNMAFKWVWILDPLITTGDYVFARASGNGIDPATAKPVKFTALLVFRLKDGKMVEDWLAYDNLGFLQQLGYKLVPPSEKQEK